MTIGRVLFIDGDLWEPFGQFAAALAQHGIVSDHLTVPPRHWQSRYSQLLERSLFERTGTHVQRGGAGNTRAWVASDQVARWVEPDTLDVQARDDLGHLLLGDPRAPAPALHHARALETPMAIYDKRLMGQLAQQCGVSTPRSWSSDQGPRVLPAVLKTPVGFGGQGVTTVTDGQQWDAALNSLRSLQSGEPFAQEFIGTRMVNVGGVAADGELVVAASYRPIPPVDDPLGPPIAVELFEHAQAGDATARLVAETGFHGIFTIDFMLDDAGEALFIDFNPRVFGAWAALQQLGVDLLGAYLHVLGAASWSRPSPPETGQRAHTLGPPPRSGSLANWWRESWRTISAWQPWLGTRWSTQARARLLAYAARHTARK